MDIHKPKPWHGWREFLKEYVIIVVGVLTALTAEAGVEWLHWRHLAEQHDSDLRLGAQTVAANALQRLSIDGCVTNELRTVAEALRAASLQWKGLNPGAAGPVAEYLPPQLWTLSRAWPYNQWESVLADGSLTHLSPERLTAYRSIYRTSEAIAGQQRTTFELMPELTPLAFDQTLTGQDRARYLTVIAHVDRIESLMASMARTILTVAANNDLWPPKTVSDPIIEASRKRMGACVKPPTQADFQPGGALAQQLLLPKR